MPYWRRKRAREIINDTHGPISEREMMKWNVPLVYINGYACALDTDWLKAADAWLQAALAKQGRDEVPVLRLAKQGNAATAALRERKRATAEKLRAGQRRRRGKAGQVLTTASAKEGHQP
jgi:hypothetical protein